MSSLIAGRQRFFAVAPVFSELSVHVFKLRDGCKPISAVEWSQGQNLAIEVISVSNRLNTRQTPALETNCLLIQL
jgi:hypothetical protein